MDIYFNVKNRVAYELCMDTLEELVEGDRNRAVGRLARNGERYERTIRLDTHNPSRLSPKSC